MPLDVLHKNATTPILLTPANFQEVMGVEYLPKLKFSDEQLRAKLEHLCSRADRKGWFDRKQKWLGSYFSEELSHEHLPDFSIRWIDDHVGYGVFAKRSISRFAFIGEYTGLVRRRALFGRLKNLYCFDYLIADALASRCVIDAKQAGNFTRYINHSATPNCETVSIYFEGVTHIGIYSLHQIEAGTQLCYDYGPDYWKRRPKPLSFG